jgi:hypothetical protein
MAFNPKTEEGSGSARKEYYKLTPGSHTLRFLPPAVVYQTHYFKAQNASVQCIGKECPICKRNFELLNQYPGNYKSQKGWSPKSKRYFCNVIDRTKVKTCSCGKEYPMNTQVCTCGLQLPDAKPRNKVFVLGYGVTLATDLDAIDDAVLDDTGSPVGISKYDVTLIVTGEGTDKKVTAVPTNNYEVLNPDSYSLYDLSDTVISLSPQEILDLMEGTSIKDIFAQRKGNKQQPKEETEVSDDELKRLNETINELLG